MPQRLPPLLERTLTPADFADLTSLTVRRGAATLTFRLRPNVLDGVYDGVIFGDGLTARLWSVPGPMTRDAPGVAPQGCQHGKVLRYPVTKPRRFGKAQVHADELVCVVCGENRYQIYTEGGVHDGMVWNHRDHDAAKSRFDNMCRLHTRKPVTKPQRG